MTGTSQESVLRARPDVRWSRLNNESDDSLCLWNAFDPLSRLAYRCGPAEYWLFQQLDGRQNLKQIYQAYTRHWPQPLSYQELATLAENLIARGLVRVSEGPGVAPHTQNKTSSSLWKRWLQSISSSLSWRVRGINPEKFLAKIAPHTDALFAPLAIRFWIIVSLCITLLVLADFRRLIEQADLWNWMIRPTSGTTLFLVFVVTRALHELGHALVLTRYGGRCPDIGMIFMLGAPCVYCDVTESWRLASARQRAAVAAGGMYVEWIVATLAAILWLSTIPGAVNTLALQTMVVCSISTILINANPLMRFDGYYILSDLLDEPNLRARSDQWAMLELKHWLLGIPRSYSAGMESASTHYRVCLVFFSIAGAIYRLSLSFGIASLVIALYSSWHLAWIGKLVALVILFTWWCIPVFTLGSSLIRSTQSWWQRFRLGALAAWAVLMICAVPFPCREFSTGWLQPESMQGIYAPVSGKLKHIAVKAGDRVSAGDLLVELDDVEPQLRNIKLHQSAAQARARLASWTRQVYTNPKSQVDLKSLEQIAQTAEQQAQHALEGVRRMTIRATQSGQIISVNAGKLVDLNDHPVGSENPQWFEPSQVGRTVPGGAMLGAVCSSQQIAVIPLEDDQLRTITTGTPVKVSTAACSSEVHSTVVSSIVRTEQVDTIARLLAEAHTLSQSSTTSPLSLTGSTGDPRRPGSTAGYAAIVQVPADWKLISAEVRASFTVPPQTLAQRMSTWAQHNLRWLMQ